MIASLTILAAACGSDGGQTTTETSTASQPTDQPAEEDGGASTVQSADGLLTIDVPAGAVADGIELSIEAVDAADLPPELDGLEVSGAYDLLPDGTTFSEPVTITYHVEDGEEEEEGAGGIAEIGIPALGRDGEWEPLGDTTVSFGVDTIDIVGTMTHFSDWVLFSGIQITYPEGSDYTEQTAPVTGAWAFRAVGSLDAVTVDFDGPQLQGLPPVATIGQRYDQPADTTSLATQWQSAGLGQLGSGLNPALVQFEYEEYIGFFVDLFAAGQATVPTLAPAFDPKCFEQNPNDPTDFGTALPACPSGLGFNGPSQFEITGNPPALEVRLDTADGGPGTAVSMNDPGVDPDTNSGWFALADGQAIDGPTGDAANFDFAIVGVAYEIPCVQLTGSYFVTPFDSNDDFSVVADGATAYYEPDTLRVGSELCF